MARDRLAVAADVRAVAGPRIAPPVLALRGEVVRPPRPARSGECGDRHGRLTQVLQCSGEDTLALESPQLTARELRLGGRGQTAEHQQDQELRDLRAGRRTCRWSASGTALRDAAWSTGSS